MSFNGELLRTERQRRDLTIEGLADLAGINWVTVSRAERGVHQPNPDTAMALGRVLDLSLDDLYPKNGDEQLHKEEE